MSSKSFWRRKSSRFFLVEDSKDQLSYKTVFFYLPFLFFCRLCHVVTPWLTANVIYCLSIIFSILQNKKRLYPVGTGHWKESGRMYLCIAPTSTIIWHTTISLTILAMHSSILSTCTSSFFIYCNLQRWWYLECDCFASIPSFLCKEIYVLLHSFHHYGVAWEKYGDATSNSLAVHKSQQTY